MKHEMTRRQAMSLLALASAFSIPLAKPAFSDDNSHAPFGLSWGMSSADVRKMGAGLDPVPDGESLGKGFAATKLSKVLGDAERVLLGFGYNDRLFKVVAIGISNGSDPYGFKTVARYEELVTALGSRYGTGSPTDTRDTEMWKGPNEYVMSLKQGRAFRLTTFSKDGTEVEISVRGQDSDTSYWTIIFDSISGSADFETQKKSKEKDAL